MTETRTHMLARLKEMRRKNHLGEFRTNRKINKVRNSSSSMARKSKSRKSSSKSMFQSTSLMSSFVGGLGYVAYESLVAPRIPINPLLKSFVEIGAGVYASRYKGVVGVVGRTAVFVNVYKLMRVYVAPMLNQVSNSTSGAVVDDSYL